MAEEDGVLAVFRQQLAVVAGLLRADPGNAQARELWAGIATAIRQRGGRVEDDEDDEGDGDSDGDGANSDGRSAHDGEEEEENEDDEDYEEDSTDDSSPVVCGEIKERALATVAEDRVASGWWVRAPARDDAAAADTRAPDTAASPLSPAAGFGEWERHTRGIGSRLLRLMGHRQGDGLGRRGEGIPYPVEAACRGPAAGGAGLGHERSEGGGKRRRRRRKARAAAGRPAAPGAAAADDGGRVFALMNRVGRASGAAEPAARPSSLTAAQVKAMPKEVLQRLLAAKLRTKDAVEAELQQLRQKAARTGSSHALQDQVTRKRGVLLTLAQDEALLTDAIGARHKRQRLAKF